MKKTKVMQFIFGLSSGGAETLVKDYAIMLNDVVDCKVVIVSYFSDASNEVALRENGISIISIRENLGLKKFYNIFKRVYYKYNTKAHRIICAMQLAKVIKEEKPDCLHIHLELLGYLEPIMDSLQGIKLVYTCHNLPDRMFGDKELEIAKKLIKNYDMQIIALHCKMAREINEIFQIDNTIVVNNAVDFERFRNPYIDALTMRKQLKIPNDAFVVGHVGRFHEQKNHMFLVEVFEQIVQKEENAFLLMVGSGELRVVVEKKLKEKGLSDKYLILENRGDMENIFPVMDVFVFPSKWEGFGNVLIEAQVANIRCIISDVVPQYVMLSPNIVSISLNKTPEQWADFILKGNFNKEYIKDLEKHDLCRIREQLLEIYGVKNKNKDN